MFFYIDGATQVVTCYSKKGDAAKGALLEMGVTVPPGGDPVVLANKHLGLNGGLVSVSSAYESISISDDQAAQELAGKFHLAIESFFNENRK